MREFVGPESVFKTFLYICSLAFSETVPDGRHERVVKKCPGSFSSLVCVMIANMLCFFALFKHFLPVFLVHTPFPDKALVPLSDFHKKTLPKFGHF